MKTTLNKIRAHYPCRRGWEILLTYLGKTRADDEDLPIATILESNGLDDALWCLRAVEGRAEEIRLYAVWCARQVQHLMKDKRSLEALEVAEAFGQGKATVEELRAAAAAAAAAYAAAAIDEAAAAEDVAYAAAYAAAIDEAAGRDRSTMRQRQTAKLLEICNQGEPHGKTSKN